MLILILSFFSISVGYCHTNSKKSKVSLLNIEIPSVFDSNEKMLKELESISEDYKEVEKDNEIMNITKNEVMDRFNNMESLINLFEVEDSNNEYQFHFPKNLKKLDECFENCTNLLEEIKNTTFSFDQVKVNNTKPSLELNKKLTKVLDNKLKSFSHFSATLRKKRIWKNSTDISEINPNQQNSHLLDNKQEKKDIQTKQLWLQMTKQYERMKNVSKFDISLFNISINSTEIPSNTSEIMRKAKEFNERLHSILNDGKVDGDYLNDQKEGNKLMKIDLQNFMEEKLKLYDTFIKNMKKSISIFEKFKFLKSENSRVTEKFEKLENSTFSNNDRFKQIPNHSFESLLKSNLNIK